VTPAGSALGIRELERLRPGLHLMALRVGTVQAAKEAAQETLSRAVVAHQSGQPEDAEHVAAFVTGIPRHVIADACPASPGSSCSGPASPAIAGRRWAR